MSDAESPSILPEFSEAKLGDARRNRRLECIAETLARDPSLSLPDAMADSAALEGAYRFLNNGSVAPAAILAPHVASTCQRASASGDVLVAHDTTEFNFGAAKGRCGLGPLQGKGSQGFFAHLSLCMSSTELREPLGTLALHTWVRSTQRKGRRSAAQALKDETNESLRWLSQVERAERELPNNACAIHLMDREGDSYGLFAGLMQRGCTFVIRAAHDRVLGVTKATLFAVASEAPLMLRREVVLSERHAPPTPRARRMHPARRRRIVSLGIHSTTVTLRRPRSAAKTTPETLTVNVVYAREVDAPAGEEPVEWLLITDLPVDTAEQVAQVLDAYRARWVIEEFFKVLKTGCTFEYLQLESYNALVRALTVYIPIAWQILLLRHLSRHAPQASASRVLNSVQIEIVKGFSNKPIAGELTVRDALLLIAARGGHIKNNGDPGWLVLNRGFRKLLALEEGWRAAQSAARSDQS